MINDLLNEALRQWMEIAGIDPESPFWTSRKSYTGEIMAARDLDPSGLTAILMLRGLFEAHLDTTTFTALEVLLKRSSVEAQLAPAQVLQELLEQPALQGVYAAFQDKILTAADHYGYQVDEGFQSFLDSKWELGFVRRDALLAMKTLVPYQFTWGDSTPEDVSFQVNQQVWEFWNVNSLLGALRSQGFEGLTLCVLRDPNHALFSYFAFAIKCGGTITVLTDRGRFEHPAQKEMWMARGLRGIIRDFDRRVAKFWFPYDLLEVETSADQKRVHVEERRGLVPYNTQGVPLARLSDCPPGCVIWLAQMFELIHETYCVRRRQLPDLSYTGEMVVRPDALVPTSSSLVLAGVYQHLDLPRLGHRDLADEEFERRAGIERRDGSTRSTHNDWMVERYGDRVPAEAFNIVGEEATHQLLPGIQASNEALAPIPKKHMASYWMRSGEEGDLPLKKTVDPLDFGTRKQLDQDRMWSARWNQVIILQRLADAEFQHEKEEMKAWYFEHVWANAEFLLDAAARGSLVLPLRPQGRLGDWEDRGKENTECLEQKEDKYWSRGYREALVPVVTNNRPFVFLRGKNYSGSGAMLCFESSQQGKQVAASVWTLIKVRTPEAIATVTGVPVADLPWPFQHYCWNAEKYEGNPNLERLDPLQFKLRNPWVPGHCVRGITLDIGICLAKRPYNARRKRLGLPKKTWPPRPPRILK